MYCSQCGHTMSPGAEFCSECGNRAAVRKPEESDSGVARPEEKLKSIGRRAWKALLAVLRNPVEGLPESFESLTLREALEAGLAFAVLFDVCAIVGLSMILLHWAGQPGIADILKILLFGFVPPAALTGALFLARKAFQASGGSIQSDVFTACLSLIPTGILLLIAGVVGIGNLEVLALVAVFALSYTVLILFTGFTRIAGIAQVRAVPAVPSVILVSAWISKIIFATIL